MYNFNNNEYYVFEYDEYIKWLIAIECKCQMCQHTFRVFDEDIEKNNNSFRCPECGQIYVLEEL